MKVIVCIHISLTSSNSISTNSRWVSIMLACVRANARRPLIFLWAATRPRDCDGNPRAAGPIRLGELVETSALFGLRGPSIVPNRLVAVFQRHPTTDPQMKRTARSIDGSRACKIDTRQTSPVAIWSRSDQTPVGSAPQEFLPIHEVLANLDPRWS